ncbi:MAG: MBL fold metallo-hydrolase [Acidobacteriota bacterium]
MSNQLYRVLLLILVALPLAIQGQVNTVQEVAPGVYFHEGDLEKGHCNNGWVVLEDYVLVIDANFPSGAQEILPKIRAISDKPIRFVFDTHHHGDHAYGNQVWVDKGAVPVAHTGVIEELKKYETGYYGTQPGRWEQAESRPDVAASKLKPPSLLFKKDLFFDDGTQRVELVHFGVGHTHGDGLAWLPKERILFTGDASVNGPHNYVGDGNIGEWIETLEAVKQLNPRIVCPGHGPVGGPEIIEDQQSFFIQLRAQAQKLLDAGKRPQEMEAAIESIRQNLLANERIARYVGRSLTAQVEKAYIELGGQPFAPKEAALERDRHIRAHGHTPHSHGRN